jgi:TonB family protein
MFAQLNLGTWRRRRILCASLVVHGALLIWMLYPPEPMLLNPVSIRIGRNGSATARIYFPTPSPDASKTSSSAKAVEKYRHQRLGHEKLTWTPNPELAKRPALPTVRTTAADKAPTQTLSNAGHGAPAGLPYGTLNRGPAFGPEIRPALPITTSDPVVYPWELPKSEGRVVVEITIDERGEITNKTVLESLGLEIDNKCLAALNGWHFQPATKNGVAIASKQDAVFPFHAGG